MRRIISLMAVGLVAACSAEPAAPPPPAEVPEVVEAGPDLSPDAVVAAEDRTDEDRAMDAGRHPAETLRFLDLKPGDTVADLMAGGGYTTELLARSVGPDGVVYGQNNAYVLERFAEKPWSERLSRSVNSTVKRLDRELEDPLGVTALDAVVMNLFYHDSVWMETDRDAMNAAIYAALRPGGTFLVIDHSAKAGSGLADVKTLHRIEAKVVEEEVKKAGFELAKTGDFLANPEDSRDWNASPGAAKEQRGTSDRFVLLFRKPQG